MSERGAPLGGARRVPTPARVIRQAPGMLNLEWTLLVRPRAPWGGARARHVPSRAKRAGHWSGASLHRVAAALDEWSRLARRVPDMRFEEVCATRLMAIAFTGMRVTSFVTKLGGHVVASWGSGCALQNKHPRLQRAIVPRATHRRTRFNGSAKFVGPAKTSQNRLQRLQRAFNGQKHRKTRFNGSTRF